MTIVCMLDFIPTAEHAAILDGTTTYDATTDVQAAVDYAMTQRRALYAPGQYKLTNTILIDGSLTLYGDGCEPYTSSISNVGTRGKGTWFYLAHIGRGFDFYGGNNSHSGGVFRGCGTYRDQPVPNGGSFTPNAHDYDIRAYNYDLLIEDVMLLNPTNGVTLVAGNYGRLTTQRLRGQPLTVGINVDKAADACHFDNTHFWTFWSNDTGVREHMVINAVGVRLYRCDNPTVSGHFSFGYGRHFLISQNVDGTVAKLRISNTDGDLGGYFLEIDNTVTGAVVALSNCVTEGKTSGGPTAYDNIHINGTSCFVSISNCELKNPQGCCINASGTTNNIIASNLTISNWNRSGGSLQAIMSASGNVISLDKFPMVQVKPAYAYFSIAAGRINCPMARGTVTGATTSAAGDVTVTHTTGTFNNTPNYIFIQPFGSTTSVTAVRQSISSTQSVIRFFNGATVINAGIVSFNWQTAY